MRGQIQQGAWRDREPWCEEGGRVGGEGYGWVNRGGAELGRTMEFMEFGERARGVSAGRQGKMAGRLSGIQQVNWMGERNWGERVEMEEREEVDGGEEWMTGVG